MKRLIFSLLCILALCPSCKDDEPVCIEYATPPVTAPDTYYGVNFPVYRLSKYEFDVYILGRGWKDVRAWQNVSQHEIDIRTGQVNPKDMLGRTDESPRPTMIGVGPVNIEFNEDRTLTEYFYYDAAMADCFRKSKLFYVEDENAVFLVDDKGNYDPSFPRMLIVQYKFDSLTTIEPVGYRSDKPIYALIQYRLLNAKERDALHEAHPTNITDIH